MKQSNINEVMMEGKTEEISVEIMKILKRKKDQIKIQCSVKIFKIKYKNT